MRLAVLLKQVPDTWGTRHLDLRTGIIDRTDPEPIMDEIGEVALEAALQEKDRGGADVVLLTMGPDDAKQMLRKALAMGADSAVHVVDDSLAGADLRLTAAVLAAAVRRVQADVVVAGNASTDGHAGMLPAMVAEHLQVPHLTFLSSLELQGGSVRGERKDEAGTTTLSSDLPAVISLVENTFEPRFPSFRDIVRAKKKPVERLTAGDLGITAPAARSVITSVGERSQERRGEKFVDDGTSGQRIVEFLKTRGLVQEG